MKRSFFILAVLVLFATGTMAQIPRIISYQGMLQGSNEQPVPEGQYKLTFKIYDEANTLLWTEAHNQVFISGGLFQVFLGSLTALNLPFDRPYFLSIQIGTDPELQPRMPLTSSAYAIRAEDANRIFGFFVSPTPQPNSLLPLDNTGKFPASVISGGVTGDFIRKNSPDTSRGTSTSPMLLISNLGDGDGINGRSINGVGVAGKSTAGDGIDGQTDASGKSGVFGHSDNGRGVVGRSGKSDGVVGWTDAADGRGVLGHSTEGLGVAGHSDKKSGVYGTTKVNNPDYAGVSGYSQDGIGVLGKSGSNTGVVGSTNGSYYGVLGQATNGTGVRGISENFNGIQAVTKSDIHAALAAGNDGAGPAIYAQATQGKIAAVFRGNVQVQSITTKAPIIELGEGLDYAEGFNVSAHTDIIPGSVLVIDPVNSGKLALSQEAYDCKVAGIVAGARGLGSGVRLGASQFDFDVALAGRVYCNVDASYGAIAPGDLLTTSPTPGYAMVVKDHDQAHGAILGKAMESLGAGQKGQILVLVTLQ